jgi:phenylalanyl-tRNA synthetase beta chain
VIDDKSEIGAVNKRKLSFAYTNTSSGLEIVQGVVDHIMSKLGLTYEDKVNGYYIQPSSEKFLFEDRQAHLFVKGVKAGVFGIVHPKVLKNFKIKTPVSIAEIDIEYIFDLIIKGELLKSV